MIAIEGLETAVIGTALRDGQQVLAYDGYVAFGLAVAEGLPVETIDDFLEVIGVASLGALAPVFVFLDAEVAEEVE